MKMINMLMEKVDFANHLERNYKYIEDKYIYFAAEVLIVVTIALVLVYLVASIWMEVGKRKDFYSCWFNRSAFSVLLFTVFFLPAIICRVANDQIRVRRKIKKRIRRRVNAIARI